MAALAAGPVAPGPVPGWSPTHHVPDGGVAAWATPNPAAAPVAHLPAGMELAVESRIDAWALVRAAGGWRGWVDGRLLVEHS